MPYAALDLRLEPGEMTDVPDRDPTPMLPLLQTQEWASAIAPASRLNGFGMNRDSPLRKDHGINCYSPGRARHAAAVFEVSASAFDRMPRPYAQ